MCNVKSKEIVKRLVSTVWYLKSCPYAISGPQVTEAITRLESLARDIEAEGDQTTIPAGAFWTIRLEPIGPIVIGPTLHCGCDACRVYQAQLDTTEAERAGAEARYQAMVIERNAIETQRADAERRAFSLAGQLELERYTTSSLTKQMETARVAHGRVGTELGKARKELESLRGGYNHATHQRDCYVRDFETMREKRRTAEAERDHARKLHSDAAVEARRNLLDLNGVKAERDTLFEERDALRAELASLAPVAAILDNARHVFAALTDPNQPATERQAFDSLMEKVKPVSSRFDGRSSVEGDGPGS